MTTTLVLLRHGQTLWSTEGRMTSRTDVGLTEVGMEQARLLGANLSRVEITSFMASPLERARVTAAVIAGQNVHRPPVVVDDRLRELDHGPFEGCRDAEVVDGPLAEAYAAWRRLDDPVFPADVEHPAAGVVRALAAIETAGSGLVVVVAHGYLLRAVSVQLLGLPPTALRRLHLDAACANVFTGEPGAFRLQAANVPPACLATVL